MLINLKLLCDFHDLHTYSTVHTYSQCDEMVEFVSGVFQSKLFTCGVSVSVSECSYFYVQCGSNFCVIHFLSYSPIFKENYTHVLCHTHCVIHFFTAIFSVILHVGTKEPIKSSYKALTLLSELLISGYVGKEKPKIRKAFRRKPKRTHQETRLPKAAEGHRLDFSCKWHSNNKTLFLQ